MKCCRMQHFIWVFSCCQSTWLGVSRLQSVKELRKREAWKCQVLASKKNVFWLSNLMINKWRVTLTNGSAGKPHVVSTYSIHRQLNIHHVLPNTPLVTEPWFNALYLMGYLFYLVNHELIFFLFTFFAKLQCDKCISCTMNINVIMNHTNILSTGVFFQHKP